MLDFTKELCPDRPLIHPTSQTKNCRFGRYVEIGDHCVLEETEGLTFLPWFLVEEPVRQGKLSVVEVSDLQAVMYSQIFYHRDKWATREMEEFVRFCTPKKA